MFLTKKVTLVVTILAFLDPASTSIFFSSANSYTTVIGTTKKGMDSSSLVYSEIPVLVAFLADLEIEVKPVKFFSNALATVDSA